MVTAKRRLLQLSLVALLLVAVLFPTLVIQAQSVDWYYSDAHPESTSVDGYTAHVAAETTDDFYPDTDPESTSVDGYVQHLDPGTGLDWSALRSAAGTSGYDSNIDWTIRIAATVTTDKFGTHERAVFVYDVSGMPGGADITSSSVRICGVSKGDGLGISSNFSLNIYDASPASDTEIVAADYAIGNFGSTAYSAPISYDSWAISGEDNTFTLNSTGVAALQAAYSGDGKFRIGLREVYYDVGGATPSWVSSATTYISGCNAERTGTDDDPKLAVTYVVGDTWAGIRDGVGTEAEDGEGGYDYGMVHITARSTTDRWDYVVRSVLVFDTSDLPDDAVIADVTLSLYGANKADTLGISPTINIYSASPASDTAVVAGDYDSLGTTAYATAITYANWDAADWNVFTLNATGIAAISTTGVTKFGLREATYDALDVEPAWSASNYALISFWLAEKGEAWAPELEITWLDIPGVSTTTGPAVEETTATLEGQIVNTGGENCSERGFQWGLTVAYGGNWTEGGSFGVEPFSHGITSLSPGTLYHFKAQALNSYGWGYGADETFTTKPEAPTLLAAATPTVSTLNLSWTKGVGAVYTMIRRKEGSYPTSPTDGTGVYLDTGSSTIAAGLSPGTKYYIAAWSFTSPNYSDASSQATGTTCCSATTGSATDIAQFGATLAGTVVTSGDSNADRIAFDWGLTAAYGSSWSTDSGAPYGAGSHTHAISSLSSSTTYHFRFRVRDDCGWNNGSDATFRTYGAPVVTTDYAMTTTIESAMLYGTLTDFGDGTTSATVWFRYGTELGNYPYSTTTAAVTALEQFSITATGLDAGVRYYFTSVAQNSLDTGYGSAETFVVEAAVIDSCNHYTEIQTSSNSSYTYLGLAVTFNHAYMINSGYTSTTSCLDAIMTESALAIPHTPSTTKLSFMLESLSGNGTVTTVYYLGATPLLSDLDFVVGYGGNATTSSDLELGDNFTVDISGVVNTSLTNKDIVRRADAFYVRVNAGNITVVVGTIASPSASVTAAVASGTHRITATSDGTTLSLYVDGAQLGNDTAASVPPSSNDWYFLLDNSMPSMEYLGIEIDEDWVLWYQPMELIASDTLVDLVGSYDAAINWGSKPSDVTITIGNLVPCKVTTIIPQEEEILPEIVQPDFDIGSDYSNLPFYDFFHEMLPLGGVPEKVFWSGAVFVIAMTLGLISIIYIKSVAVMLGVMGIVFVAGIMTDPPILPYWVPLVYGLLAVVYLIRRQASPI